MNDARPAPRTPVSIAGKHGFGLFFGPETRVAWMAGDETTWVGGALLTRSPELGVELGVATRVMAHDSEGRGAGETALHPGRTWEAGLTAGWSPSPEALVAPGACLDLGLGMTSWTSGEDDGDDLGIAVTPSVQAQLHVFPWLRIGASIGYRIPALLDAEALEAYTTGAPVMALSAQVGVHDVRRPTTPP